MPDYMPKLLQSLKHSQPTIPCHSPHPAPEMQHGKKAQLAINDDDAPLLSKKENTLVRQIISSVFFFAQMLDLTLLLPTNELALQQTDSTTTTLNLYT